MGTTGNAAHREPWNKGKIVGQKAPFKLKDIWALRVRLQMEGRVRELALFNLGIDSKLRLYGCTKYRGHLDSQETSPLHRCLLLTRSN